MAPRPISASMRYFPTNRPIIESFMITALASARSLSYGLSLRSRATLPAREPLEEGAVLLRGFATAEAPALLEEVARIAQSAPFRHLVTPGGYTMSVAMTNCGRVGWVSDRTGYRYDPIDPDTGAPWPAMPAAFLDLAVRAAAEAGFANYDPDACLINRYVAGAKLSLHQDRDEKDAWAPIVSVSLGLPAVFLWGGKRRSDPPPLARER